MSAEPGGLSLSRRLAWLAAIVGALVSAFCLASAILSGAVIAALGAWLALAVTAAAGWSARNWRIRGQ